jgi:hypothetical protein
LAHNKEQEKENKKTDFKNAQLKRSNWESSHMGDFSLIFPSTNPIFDTFLKSSQQIWLESTGRRLVNKDNRPQSQDCGIKNSTPFKKSPQNQPRKSDLAVFQRLYKIKKVKVEPGPVPPCVQLDEAFRTTYFKSQTPYSFIELVVPKKTTEKVRNKSIPKKRISMYHQHIEDIFKEKRFGERMTSFGNPRSFNVYETPLQIYSVITDDSQMQDSQKTRFYKQIMLKKLF